jgi:hypothetical protein
MCLLDELWERYGCPACRAARVAEAFRPIDPLRTAQGIPGSFTVGKDGEIRAVDYSWHGEKTVGFAHGAEKTPQTEVPRGCKMPQGDDAQTYELRRLFRL